MELEKAQGMEDAKHGSVEATGQGSYDEECQPTSSHIKMEDLVTDEKDNHHKAEHHIPIEPITDAKPPWVRFWDCPKSEYGTVWPGDNCVPHEWNQVINDMWEIDSIHKAPLFNYPDFPLAEGWNINDWLLFIVPTLRVESEGPYEFTPTMYPDEHRWEYIHHNLSWDNESGGNDLDVRIA